VDWKNLDVYDDSDEDVGGGGGGGGGDVYGGDGGGGAGSSDVVGGGSRGRGRALSRDGDVVGGGGGGAGAGASADAARPDSYLDSTRDHKYGCSGAVMTTQEVEENDDDDAAVAEAFAKRNLDRQKQTMGANENENEGRRVQSATLDPTNSMEEDWGGGRIVGESDFGGALRRPPPEAPDPRASFLHDFPKKGFRGLFSDRYGYRDTDPEPVAPPPGVRSQAQLSTVGPGRYSPPCHMILFNPRHEKRVDDAESAISILGPATYF